MAQPFSMRYPLVDGQGNFGSVDGDSPAAMRYTEVRMARIAHLMLEGLDQDTVDMQPNYDGNEMMPEVLPGLLPNLLVNGSAGIAVGMATNIPPHNLTEICNASLALIENPDMSVDALMDLVSGPDFPTGGSSWAGEAFAMPAAPAGGPSTFARAPRLSRRTTANPSSSLKSLSRSTNLA